jgi:hypothetical protein
MARAIFIPCAALLCAGTLCAPALASSSASSSEVSTSAGTQRNSGTTSSAVMVDAADFAQSFVDTTHGTLGAAAQVDGLVGFDAQTSASHDSGYLCAATTTCVTTPPVFPLRVQFHLGIDGTASGRYYDLVATYGTSFGDTFRFEIENDGSVGPAFVGASFNGNPLAVTVVTDNAGNASFSLDATIVVTELLNAQTYTPGSTVFIDDQSIQLDVGAANNGSGVDALHTFGISAASLDPAFPIASMDAPPVPEPGAAALLGSGLVLLWVGRRRLGPRG